MIFWKLNKKTNKKKQNYMNIMKMLLEILFRIELILKMKMDNFFLMKTK